ncbi:hypothetical protein FRC01_002538 [Tulasnella sp. 417]|nr:hypothetical protein FRC01_002538 [Tulasnella sp. 417]
MKLSTLHLSSLMLLPLATSVAAIPTGVPRNGTLAKRGGEVNYLAQCSRFGPGAGAELYQASYIAWYANSDNSQNQQKPDSLSNEYRDWSTAAGRRLTWEGTEQSIHFKDSGITIQTHIDADALSRGLYAWGGWIQRTSDWRTFDCYKDNNRILFDWRPPVPDGTQNKIFCYADYWCV